MNLMFVCIKNVNQFCWKTANFGKSEALISISNVMHHKSRWNLIHGWCFFYRSKQKRNKSISIFFSSRFGNRRCNCCDKQLISYHIKTNRHDSVHLTLAHSFALHVPVEEFVVFYTSAIHRQLNLQIVICIICNGSEWMWCGFFRCMNLTLLYIIISTQSTKVQT